MEPEEQERFRGQIINSCEFAGLQLIEGVYSARTTAAQTSMRAEQIPPMSNAPLAACATPVPKSLLCSMLLRRAGSNWVEDNRKWKQQ
jgi:hypothetical protein